MVVFPVVGHLIADDEAKGYTVRVWQYFPWAALVGAAYTFLFLRRMAYFAARSNRAGLFTGPLYLGILAQTLFSVMGEPTGRGARVDSVFSSSPAMKATIALTNKRRLGVVFRWFSTDFLVTAIACPIKPGDIITRAESPRSRAILGSRLTSIHTAGDLVVALYRARSRIIFLTLEDRGAVRVELVAPSDGVPEDLHPI